MKQSPVNWRFFSIFVVSAGLALGVYFALHAHQVRRQSELLPATAERYAAEGKTARALRTLSRYLISHPSDNKIRLQYARMMIGANPDKTGQAQAIAALETVLRNEPQNDEALAELAKFLTDTGRWSDAVPVLEQLAGRPDREHWVIESLSRAYSYRRPNPSWEKVEALLSPVCMGSKSPVPSDYARLAEARRQSKNTKAADEVMEKLIRDHGDKAEAFLIRAGYREQYGFKNAGEDLEQARKMAPSDPKVAAARASRELAKKDGVAALAELSLSMKAHPDDATLLKLAADAEALAGHASETLKFLKRAAAAEPRNAELALNVAQAMVDLGDFSAASEQLKIVRGMGGADSDEVELLGARLRLEAGDWPAAMTVLKKIAGKYANADNPRPTDAIYALLARCAGMAGDLPSQIEYATEAAKSPNPAGRMILAACLADAGKLDAAAGEYQRVLREQKSPPAAAAFGLAQLLVIKLGGAPESARKDSDKAEVDRLLDMAQKAAPGAWEIHVLRAELALSFNKIEDAKKILEGARKMLPAEKSLWAASAAAEARAGRMAEAEELLRQGGKTAGDSADLRLTGLRIRFAGKGDKMAALADVAAGIDSLPVTEKLRIWSAQADGYELLNKPAEAAKTLDLFLAVRDNDLRILLVRFDLAARLGDEPTASRCLEEIRRLDGSGGALSEYVAAFRITRDVQAKTADPTRLEEARRHAIEADFRKPGWGKLALLRAEIEELAGNTDKAAEEFEKAFKNGERSFTLLRRLVNYYTERGQNKKASELITKIKEQGKLSLSQSQSRALAEIYLQAPDFARALEMAQEAVDNQSKNPDDLIWLARVNYAADRPAGEIEIPLKKATEIAPESPAAWSARIAYLSNTNRKAEAQQLLGLVTKSVSADKVSMILAPCHDVLGESDKAESHYLKALAERPTDLRLAQGASAFFARTGRWALAERTLRGITEGKLEATRADMLTARRDLAAALGALGRPNEALPLLENNAPADARLRAVILARNPLTQRAAFEVLDSEFNRRPLTAAELFLYARLSVNIEEPTAAKGAMLALLGADPNNPEYLAFWIEYLLGRRDFSDARFYQSKLARARPGEFDSIRLQALADFKQGKQDQAIELLRSYDPPTTREEALLAGAFEEINDFDDAEKRLRAYAEKTADGYSRLALARYLGRRSSYAEALDIAEKARPKVPTDLVAIIAMDLLRAGTTAPPAEQVKRVEQWLVDATPPADRPWQPTWLLAEMADIRGDDPEAINRFRKALALTAGLAPSQETAGRSLIVPGLARLLCLTGGAPEAAEAGKLLALALQAAPANSTELAELEGLALLKQRKPSEAVQRLNALARTAPSAKGKFYLALALLETGSKKEAEVAWQQALRRGLKKFELHRAEFSSWEKLETELAPKPK